MRRPPSAGSADRRDSRVRCVRRGSPGAIAESGGLRWPASFARLSGCCGSDLVWFCWLFWASGSKRRAHDSGSGWLLLLPCAALSSATPSRFIPALSPASSFRPLLLTASLLLRSEAPVALPDTLRDCLQFAAVPPTRLSASKPSTCH